ncbi:hypothetical protein CC1G_14964 [Coprinopsis cinerea okayama7|uniref:Secreted protein n=1 Tax=Coprinopsis cinerea (strain Okayama-7 / 130 / ATCC MYA-4618 / FGSC 9003) TaxID=240176 RepID=D6RP96_COPC7|nr:hypothetical protein CC1G_14964 [Coprinopsis cinerea okayama7\|eukprot:XP_002910633.1 hypothetical protein CC1G_14964 [Coprinopsis cinerea okayama7\
MNAIWTTWILLSLASAIPLNDQTILHSTSVEKAGWYDPRVNGGRLLDVRSLLSWYLFGQFILAQFTAGTQGEPLNIIISSNSDPYILTDSGFVGYAKSIGYSHECLGLHYGHKHEANLGDGDGQKPELVLARQHYFPVWGTCWESLAGGQHFRAWKQNGSLADSGAWFVGRNHMIVPNGYNLGRDWFVKRALKGTNWNGRWWKAQVEWRTDLLEKGNKGQLTLPHILNSLILITSLAPTDVNHGIAQDGRVAVMTVIRQ